MGMMPEPDFFTGNKFVLDSRIPSAKTYYKDFNRNIEDLDKKIRD